MNDILEKYSNKAPRKWPSGQKYSYNDILEKTLLLLEDFDYEKYNYRESAAENLIEIAVISTIRDKNIELAKRILSKFNENEKTLAQSIIVFHCIKNQINFEDFFDQCNDWLKSHEPQPLYYKVYSNMALNSFLLDNFPLQNLYKEKARNTLEEYRDVDNKWAYLNMLIFTNSFDEIPILQQNFDFEEKSFHAPEILNNIILYERIELLFKFKELCYNSRDDEHDVYNFFIKKIKYSKLFDKLVDYVNLFNSVYGLRIVFPTLIQTQVTSQQLQYWLSKEKVESMDFMLLLYALQFPKECKDFISKNTSKLSDYLNNSFFDECGFNLGKISSLIKLDIKIKDDDLENRVDYFAGMAYYCTDEEKRLKFINKSLELYTQQNDNPYIIEKLCYLIEASKKNEYEKHNALVNYAISECLRYKRFKDLYLENLINSLCKVGDFSNAVKVWRKIPKSKRLARMERFFWTLCTDKNYDGLHYFLEQIDSQDYGDSSMAYRIIKTLNDYGDHCFTYYPESCHPIT